MPTLILFILLIIPALACTEPLRVFVSVLPQKTFVEKIGGEHVEVQTMVRPGHSPTTYDPTQQQISALSKTVLYVRSDVPFEKAWMERIHTANPNMQVLDARKSIESRIIEHHEHEFQDNQDEPLSGKKPYNAHYDASEQNPHFWTSPPLVKHMARNIRDTLTKLTPANGQDYAHNYETFATELDILDRDIRTLLQDATNRKFMVFHPAWGYFADTYGQIQVPIEKEGKEPGARALAALIEQARCENVRVIFVQPQFDKKSANQVARAIGGRVIAIDPLSPDYAHNLRKVTRQIAEAA